MKQFLIALLIFTLPCLVSAQSSKKSLKGKIGISLYGGANILTGGDYSKSVKVTDLLNTGSQFGIGLSYFFTKGFGVEGMLYGGYNYYNDKYKPAGKDPLWLTLSASVNAVYNFGHLFSKPVISPVVRVGAGIYQWEHIQDGLFHATVTTDNSNHDAKSFGFNAGLGAEYSLSKKFTIGLMVDYITFHPKYEGESAELTESERTTHSFISPQLKLTYYIPTQKK